MLVNIASFNRTRFFRITQHIHQILDSLPRLIPDSIHVLHVNKFHQQIRQVQVNLLVGKMGFPQSSVSQGKKQFTYRMVRYSLESQEGMT